MSEISRWALLAGAAALPPAATGSLTRTCMCGSTIRSFRLQRGARSRARRHAGDAHRADEAPTASAEDGDHSGDPLPLRQPLSGFGAETVSGVVPGSVRAWIRSTRAPDHLSRIHGTTGFHGVRYQPRRRCQRRLDSRPADASTMGAVPRLAGSHDAAGPHRPHAGCRTADRALSGPDRGDRSHGRLPRGPTR